MRVRANSYYRYEPCILDRVDARTDLRAGDVVQVRNLHGCPPCNTMGHAHVYKDGQFAGLVSTASLHRRDEWPAEDDSDEGPYDPTRAGGLYEPLSDE